MQHVAETTMSHQIPYVIKVNGEKIYTHEHIMQLGARKQVLLQKKCTEFQEKTHLIFSSSY